MWNLRFEKEALEEVAALAIKRKTGARGLRTSYGRDYDRCDV